MSIERHYSLTQAAKMIGVRRQTLKLWLAECAIVLPQLPRGSKVMLRESQIQQVLRKREAKADWAWCAFEGLRNGTERKKTERMLLQLSDDMARSVRALAELEHRTIQDQFRFLIANALQQTQQGSGNGTSERTRRAVSTPRYAIYCQKMKLTSPSTPKSRTDNSRTSTLPGTAGPIAARKRRVA